MTTFIDMPPVPPWVGPVLRGAPAPPAASSSDVATLEQHGLIPLLHDLGVASLRDAAREAALVEPLRLRDLRRVLDALAVPLLITKGTALAYDLYAAPEHRPRGDVDLLVAEADLPRVRNTFATLGFTERVTSGDELGIRQAAFSRVDDFGAEHVYDVHWDVTNTAVFRGALRFDELLTRAIALPRIHEQARGLAHVDALLLACIHRVAHHHDSARLIWLYDIHLLRAAMSRDEHAEFWRLARERRVVAICERSIELAEELMGVAAHERAAEHLEEIPRDEATRIFLDRDAVRGELFVAELHALGNWRSRGKRLWQLAFPPAAFMRERFPHRTPLLLPWLYVWRVLRGLARLLRRAA